MIEKLVGNVLILAGAAIVLRLAFRDRPSAWRTIHGAVAALLVLAGLYLSAPRFTVKSAPEKTAAVQEARS